MGPNGSGKSTLSHVLMGKPGYEVLGGSVTLDGVDLLALEPWERAQAGLFLAMQYPIEVPGVSLARRARRGVSGRRPRRRRVAERMVGRGRAHRLRRAVLDAAAQRRPVRRREEAERDAAAGRARPEDRHPRRARLRPRRRRPAGRVPPRRGGHHRGRPRRAGHHPLQPPARRAAARRGAHPRQGPDPRIGRPRAGRPARGRGLRRLADGREDGHGQTNAAVHRRDQRCARRSARLGRADGRCAGS